MFSFCHLACSTWMLFLKNILRALRERISFNVFLLSFCMFKLDAIAKIFLCASRESISFIVFLLSFGISTLHATPKTFSSRFARKHKLQCFPFVIHKGFSFIISFSSSFSSSIGWGSGIPKTIYFSAQVAQNLRRGSKLKMITTWHRTARAAAAV